VQKALKLLLPACVILVLLALGLHYVKGPADIAKAKTVVEQVTDKVKDATKP
jgi:hypothetical protein